MSVPQGSTAFNAKYFDNVDLAISATVTCDGLQKIFTQVTASVNGTLSAVTTQLGLVQSDYLQFADRITTLENQIATMTASQTAFATLSTQSSTVSAVVDITTAIAYLKAQAAVTATLGVAGNASFVMQALKLAQDLIAVTTAYNRLERQIVSLTALITDIPARLASIESAIAAKASTLANCTIS